MVNGTFRDRGGCASFRAVRERRDRMEASAGEIAGTIRDAIGTGTLNSLVAARDSHVFRNVVSDPPKLLTSNDVLNLFEDETFPAEALRVFSRRLLLHGPTMGFVREGVVRPGPLLQLAAQGVTIIINDLVPHLPRLAPMARAMADWLGDPVDLNCFASFGSESGLPIHHDEMHLLLVQLEGTKQWTLHGAPVPIGSNRYPGDGVPGPNREVVTEPGDVLFLPAGQRHSACAEGASLHMGIMPTHMTGKDLLRRLVKRHEDDVQLREPAVAFLGPVAVQEAIDSWRAYLHQLIDTYDFASELERARTDQEGEPKIPLK